MSLTDLAEKETWP